MPIKLWNKSINLLQCSNLFGFCKRKIMWEWNVAYGDEHKQATTDKYGGNAPHYMCRGLFMLYIVHALLRGNRKCVCTVQCTMHIWPMAKRQSEK
jgi:hypothetical protein